MYFIAIAFLFYILFYFFIINKKIINIYTIVLFYMLLAYYFGIWTFDTAKELVTPFNDSFLDQTIFLFNLSYFYIEITILIILIISKIKIRTSQHIKNKNIDLMKYIAVDVPFALIIVFSIPIFIVFTMIYIPGLQENLSISKYFQDRLDEFIRYRPFYTLSLNLLSVFLFMEIVNLIVENKDRTIKILKVFFIFIILIATGKRGQLFFPIFIVGLSYFMYKKKYLSLLFMLLSTIFLGSLLRMNSFSDIFDISLITLYKSFSSSFFVSIRELTRLLSFFDNNYLYGLTYLADLGSFIPTSINPFKNEYNYMRYITYLSGENPDLFGGMRATYIGEAFINFGVYGVMFISIIFGILLSAIQKIINKTSYYQSFAYYIILFWAVKMIALPFFENGSAMFLFFLITIFGFFLVNFINKIQLKGLK